MATNLKCPQRARSHVSDAKFCQGAMPKETVNRLLDMLLVKVLIDQGLSPETASAMVGRLQEQRALSGK